MLRLAGVRPGPLGRPVARQQQAMNDLERLQRELERTGNDNTRQQLNLELRIPEKLSRRYVEFGLEHPEYYEVMFQLHPEQMARYPAEKYRRARRNLELFTEALRSGVADGVLRVDDPVADTAALWATLHGAVSLQLARRVDVKIAPPAFVEAVVRQAVRARGYDVAIGGTLYGDALGEAGTAASTYLGMVRHNIDTIVSALAPAAS